MALQSQIPHAARRVQKALDAAIRLTPETLQITCKKHTLTRQTTPVLSAREVQQPPRGSLPDT